MTSGQIARYKTGQIKNSQQTALAEIAMCPLMAHSRQSNFSEAGIQKCLHQLPPFYKPI